MGHYCTRCAKRSNRIYVAEAAKENDGQPALTRQAWPEFTGVHPQKQAFVGPLERFAVNTFELVDGKAVLMRQRFSERFEPWSTILHNTLTALAESRAWRAQGSQMWILLCNQVGIDTQCLPSPTKFEETLCTVVDVYRESDPRIENVIQGLHFESLVLSTENSEAFLRLRIL